MKPNFKDINIKAVAAQKDLAEWTAKNNIKKDWVTPEQIPVKGALHGRILPRTALTTRVVISRANSPKLRKKS